VLVVDDDAGMREVIAESLRLDGCVVATAANGAAALEQVRRYPPDLIVLDLMMPVMDGWTFARVCHTDPVGHGIPIVVLSASTRASTALEELAGTGVRAVLNKPFGLEALLGAVQDHAARPATVPEARRSTLAGT
jgi:CheY-like chemotaxis protein